MLLAQQRTIGLRTAEDIIVLYLFIAMIYYVITHLFASIARRVLDFPSLDEIIAATESDSNPFPRFTVEILMFLVVLIAMIAGIVTAIRRLLGIRSRKKARRKPVKSINRYYR